MEASLHTIGFYLAGSLQAFIGAGLGAALVTGGIAVYRDKRQQKALATYTAMRVAIALENYIYRSVDAITQNENAEDDPKDEFPHWNTVLAVPPDYPDDPEGWRALDIDLANRALAFPAVLHAKQRDTSQRAEEMNNEWLDHYMEASASLGVSAWQIADALRKRYKIRLGDDLSPASDVAESLKGTLVSMQSKIRATNEARNKITAKVWEYAFPDKSGQEGIN